eukprot:GHVS01066967.1.p1 GENE.GHVS01066967.1~~GHVS01066967.1.p1  ORF type:complete len:108 (+),score=9.33 GHVS01066967.1:336-659(+)
MEKLEAAMIQAAVPKQPGDGEGLFSSVFQSKGSASRKRTSARDTRRPAEQATVPKQSVYGEGIFSSVLQSIVGCSTCLAVPKVVYECRLISIYAFPLLTSTVLLASQ